MNKLKHWLIYTELINQNCPKSKFWKKFSEDIMLRVFPVQFLNWVRKRCSIFCELKSAITLLKQVFTIKFISKKLLWKLLVCLSGCKNFFISNINFSLWLYLQKNVLLSKIVLRNLELFISDCLWFEIPRSSKNAVLHKELISVTNNSRFRNSLLIFTWQRWLHHRLVATINPKGSCKCDNNST